MKITKKVPWNLVWTLHQINRVFVERNKVLFYFLSPAGSESFCNYSLNFHSFYVVSSFVFSSFSLVSSLWSILNISPSPWILPSLNFFVFYFYFFTFTQWILCGCELYDLWNNGCLFNWDSIWKLRALMTNMVWFLWDFSPQFRFLCFFHSLLFLALWLWLRKGSVSVVSATWFLHEFCFSLIHLW